MIVDVYNNVEDIFVDGRHVGHIRFVFEDSKKALDFIDEVVNEHHKVVVVSAELPVKG